MQNDYRQTFFSESNNFQLQIQNRAARRNKSIRETALREYWQRIPDCRYRFSLELSIIAITDTDFGLETNQFCKSFGFNGSMFSEGVSLRVSAGNPSFQQFSVADAPPHALRWLSSEGSKRPDRLSEPSLPFPQGLTKAQPFPRCFI